MHEVPEIETRIIESGDRIYGIGEAATPTAAPALGNAIFAATGQRIRQLPFDKFVSFA
jgi:isoquinoline 1-oxidoreductase beta subunit